MPSATLSPRALCRLRELSRRASAVVQLDAVPLRDAVTGAFTTRGTVAPSALRKVWAMPAKIGPLAAPRANFKTALVAALRAPRA